MEPTGPQESTMAATNPAWGGLVGAGLVLVARLWRVRRWWLPPLLAALALLLAAWLVTPAHPLSHFVYGDQ